MRKQTKVAAVVSAAALLAIGASMTSFAKGWTQEDGEWVFLDSDNERVYGEWKKSVDGNYYWLDEETGVMATDRLVEDEDNTYYVGSAGVRVTNGWVAVENEDGESVNGVEVEALWYYFGSNGKAYKGDDGALAKKTINGATYFFDDNGWMQHGWVEHVYEKNNETKRDTYYCGDENEGWAAKGWMYLETESNEDIPSGVYEDEEWFYFDGGKLKKDGTKYINGHYYKFDEFGVMVDGWYTAGVATSAQGVATSAKAYATSNGTLGNGWVKADNSDGDSKWYYMVTVRDAENKAYRAVPFNFGSDAGYRAKSINGKTYLFNDKGEMQTGLQDLRKKVVASATENYDGITHKALENEIYYFSKESGSNEGRMLTGKVTHTDDGEDFFYYFGKDGVALREQIKDNVIYNQDGKRIQAEDGNTYEIITLDDFDVKSAVKNDDGTYDVIIPAGSEQKVVVSSTGKIRTSGSVRIDGEKYEIKIDKDAKTYRVKHIVED